MTRRHPKLPTLQLKDCGRYLHKVLPKKHASVTERGFLLAGSIVISAVFLLPMPLAAEI